MRVQELKLLEDISKLKWILVFNINDLYEGKIDGYFDEDNKIMIVLQIYL